MYAMIARALVRRTLRRHLAGDVEGVLRSYADDVRFVFPGTSSWAADLRGKPAVRTWLERFYRAGLELEAREVLVAGPPWNTTICVRFTDRARGDEGEIVYENRGVIFGKGAWGKVTYYEVCEDTEKVLAFDEWLLPREAAER